MSMLKDNSPALLIILVIVVGGLAYLLSPGRLNGPTSGSVSTSTATSTELQVITVGAEVGSSTSR